MDKARYSVFQFWTFVADCRLWFSSKSLAVGSSWRHFLSLNLWHGKCRREAPNDSFHFSITIKHESLLLKFRPQINPPTAT